MCTSPSTHVKDFLLGICQEGKLLIGGVSKCLPLKENATLPRIDINHVKHLLADNKDNYYHSYALATKL